MTDSTEGTSTTSWKRTAKPSRIALSNRGESASAKTSSRIMRWAESARATASADIRSGRSFDFATDITISSPRSIGSIIEQRARLGRMENELLAVHAHVYGPVILEFDRESRTATNDADVFGIDVDAEFVSLLNNFRSQLFRSFPICYGKNNFLVNEIVVLKSCKIGRAILGPSKED